MVTSWRLSSAAGLRGGESLLELLGRLTQRLVDDFDVVDHGHEIGVAVPARDDVKVDVVGDSGARLAPDVDANVETVGVHDLLQHRHGALDGAHDIPSLRVVEIDEAGSMRKRCHHRMPG